MHFNLPSNFPLHQHTVNIQLFSNKVAAISILIHSSIRSLIHPVPAFPSAFLHLSPKYTSLCLHPSIHSLHHYMHLCHQYLPPLTCHINLAGDGFPYGVVHEARVGGQGVGGGRQAQTGLEALWGHVLRQRLIAHAPSGGGRGGGGRADEARCCYS